MKTEFKLLHSVIAGALMMTLITGCADEGPPASEMPTTDGDQGSSSTAVAGDSSTEPESAGETGEAAAEDTSTEVAAEVHGEASADEHHPADATEEHNYVVVTDKDFDKVVLQAETPVLVDFGASWCGPCQAILPVIDDLAKEYKGRVLVAKVDVDESPGLAAKYDVTLLPTFVYIKGGEQLDSAVGLPAENLKECRSAFATRLDELAN